MLVWILILGLWVALLSLILHDATKEDSDGSAVLIAARNVKAFIFWAGRKSVWKSRVKVATAVEVISSSSKPSEPSKITAVEVISSSPKPSEPSKITAVEVISSPSKPIEPGKIKQAPARPPKWTRSRKESRASITIPELELAISEAVKKASPDCEDLVGVIVQHKTPKSHLDPNWAIRGVKFGNADRALANEALATVIERMKREFLLSDD